MKPASLLCFVHLFFCFFASAGKITGTITDDKGNILPYASVMVKGTSKGTTANQEGKYILNLENDRYIIVCQYVGYTKQEKAVVLTDQNLVLDFHLAVQQLSLSEVTVRPGGEDPAYEIIRQAIRKRKGYEAPLDSFTCEAYIKTLIKTRHLPNRIFGQKIADDDKKEMGVDSAGRGIIYLSESLTRIAFKKPGKIKLEILSGRESGSNGYGFNFPTFINFYSNNVSVFSSRLNPRGFVSPIADAAMNYYRYKFLGSFWEDGREINKIRVIPRRKYEPLFTGTINIVDGEWRIHSLDLQLSKESQLEILDTVEIRQIHVPVTKNVWQTKDQVVYFTFNILGIDAIGNFLNVYNKYDVSPQFKKKYFNNVVVKYDTAVNKKTKSYWDSVRPVQLEPEELNNYKTKDSIFQYNRDSVWSRRNIDSLRRHQKHITVVGIFWSGYRHQNFDPGHPASFTWEPLLPNIQYNTVEGLAVNGEVTLQKSFAKLKERISFTPHLRYGFANTHLNAWGTLVFSRRTFEWNEQGGSANRSSWTFAGGKRISQFNPENPISPLVNEAYTLIVRDNYMKLYENYFGNIVYNNRFDNGLRLNLGVLYEDRLPIDNSTNFSFFGDKSKMFTPNYPYEKISTQFTRYQALITRIGMQYKPGQRFIEFPHNKVPIGSKFPTLELVYQHGWNGIVGSDVNFDKWKFSVWDDVNFKLRGNLKYRISVGGFLNNKSVFIQDYQHFNGNQTIFASEFLNSFQLSPYYANSTTASFYATANLEHHFNGFLTNKIPWFRKLNWYLVGGVNAFYVNGTDNYVEVFGGLENIFKIIRLDLVGSYLNGHNGQVGIRIGFGGLIGGSITANNNQVRVM